MASSSVIDLFTKLEKTNDCQTVCLFIQDNAELKKKITMMKTIVHYSPKQTSWPSIWETFEITAMKPKNNSVVFIVCSDISSISDLTPQEKEFVHIMIKYLQTKTYVNRIYFLVKDDVFLPVNKSAIDALTLKERPLQPVAVIKQQPIVSSAPVIQQNESESFKWPETIKSTQFNRYPAIASKLPVHQEKIDLRSIPELEKIISAMGMPAIASYQKNALIVPTFPFNPSVFMKNINMENQLDNKVSTYKYIIPIGAKLWIANENAYLSALKAFILSILPLCLISNETMDAFVSETMLRTIWLDAFTDKTFNLERNYEKLETLGDATQKAAFVEFIYDQNMTPDEITNLTSRLLSTTFQSDLSSALGLTLLFRTWQTPIASIREDLVEAFTGALYTIANTIHSSAGNTLLYNFFFSIMSTTDLDLFKEKDSKTYVEQTLRIIGCFSIEDSAEDTLLSFSLLPNMEWKVTLSLPENVRSIFIERISTSIASSEEERTCLFNGIRRLRTTNDFILGTGQHTDRETAKFIMYKSAHIFLKEMGITEAFRHQKLKKRKDIPVNIPSHIENEFMKRLAERGFSGFIVEEADDRKRKKQGEKNYIAIMYGSIQNQDGTTTIHPEAIAHYNYEKPGDTYQYKVEKLMEAFLQSTMKVVTKK